MRMSDWSSDVCSSDLSLLEDPANQPCFSPVSLWEIAIKSSLGCADFQIDAGLIRRGLTDNGYLELPISGEHEVRIATLPTLQRDQFDRMLVAEAQAEGSTQGNGDANDTEAERGGKGK